MVGKDQGSARRERYGFANRKMLLAGIASAAILAGAGLNFVQPVHSYAAAVPAATVSAQSPNSFAGVIQAVTPAVVSVKVQGKMPVQNASQDSLYDGSSTQSFDPFRFFGGFGGRRQPPVAFRAEGSGFFISSDGYLMTNNHVVANATEVQVVTSDGRTLRAKVVGTDPKTDLALLKVAGDGFTYVRFAEQAPRVGDWVVAMGNPFGLGETATAGIVSAEDRNIGEGPYDNFLQIDAPVNRGNSGGPSFNVRGEVVGVNTAIFSPTGGSVGIGFDIPADTVKAVYTALRDNGSVARGALGVEIQSVTPDIADAIGAKDAHGALVAEATAGSAAQRAGIAAGDVITAVDGRPVRDAHDLARRINVMPPGTRVSLTYLRDGASHSAEAVLGKLPQDKPAPTPSEG